MDQITYWIWLPSLAFSRTVYIGGKSWIIWWFELKEQYLSKINSLMLCTCSRLCNWYLAHSGLGPLQLTTLLTWNRHSKYQERNTYADQVQVGKTLIYLALYLGHSSLWCSANLASHKTFHYCTKINMFICRFYKDLWTLVSSRTAALTYSEVICSFSCFSLSPVLITVLLFDDSLVWIYSVCIWRKLLQVF